MKGTGGLCNSARDGPPVKPQSRALTLVVFSGTTVSLLVLGYGFMISFCMIYYGNKLVSMEIKPTKKGIFPQYKGVIGYHVKTSLISVFSLCILFYEAPHMLNLY